MAVIRPFGPVAFAASVALNGAVLVALDSGFGALAPARDDVHAAKVSWRIELVPVFEPELAVALAAEEQTKPEEQEVELAAAPPPEQSDRAVDAVERIVPARLPSPPAARLPSPMPEAVRRTEESRPDPVPPRDVEQEPPARVASLPPSPSPVSDVMPAPDIRLRLTFGEEDGFAGLTFVMGSDTEAAGTPTSNVLLHHDVVSIQHHIDRAWSEILGRESVRSRGAYAVEIELRLLISGDIRRLIVSANDRETSEDPQFPRLARLLIDHLLRQSQLPLTAGAYPLGSVLIWRFWL